MTHASPDGARPRVLRVSATQPSRRRLAPAAAALAGGALVAFPTETVYGLGAHALDEAAVGRVFRVKGRPAADPLIVHILDWSAALRLIDPSFQALAEARRLAQAFWPGPLTLVLPKAAIVPDGVTAGLDSVALRAPAHPVARLLLELAAVPVAAPSANPFGGISPTRAEDVLRDLDGRIDWLIDAGPSRHGLESTVVDCRGHVPRILRPGALSLEAIRQVSPAIIGGETWPEGAPSGRSPGQASRHYAPRRAQVRLLIGSPERTRAAMEDLGRREAAAGRRVALLVPAEDAPRLRLALGEGILVRPLGSRVDLPAAAHGLYAALRELDEVGIDLILAADYGEVGLGPALRDRLSRASEGRVLRLKSAGTRVNVKISKVRSPNP